VLYATGKTSGTYCNKAYLAFKTKKKWPNNTVRKGSYLKENLALLERDGSNCFYCGHPLHDDVTLEHLIPLNSGGTNLLSNMVLAHKMCNHNAGNKTIHEKVLLAINYRLKNN